jgi:hypothetical protein
MITASGGSDAAGITIIILLVTLGIIAYWVPTIVAQMRHVPNLGSVVVINAFLGWTIAGWVVALAMASRDVPGGPPPGWMPPPGAPYQDS